MKRRFASPLRLTRDSPPGEADVSIWPNTDRYSSQPEMRRFSSPLVFKRAPELSLGSVSKDQSTEVPKTPNRCLKAESATRTVNRRLFHASERHSQVKDDVLSAASIRRTPPRPPVFAKANKRGAHEVAEFSKSGPDNAQRQAGSILRQSIDSQPETRENLAQGSNAPQIRLANNTDVSPGRDEEFPQPCHYLSVSKGRAFNLDSEQTLLVVGSHQIRQAGNLSQLLLKSEIARTKMTGPGGKHNDSPPFIISPDSPMKLASDRVCNVEVFSSPALTDMATLACNGATSLHTMIECRFVGAHAKVATSPTRSVQEHEQINDCAKKLKMLLVPSFLPFADLVQENRTPKSVIQTLTKVYGVQPSNQLSRDRITENAMSFDEVQPEILDEDKKVNESVNNCFVKTTKLLKQVSGEKHLHLRLSAQQQERTSNQLQIIHDGILDDNHTVLISPQKVAKSCVTIACTQSPKERLSPSSRYAAQSLEFRSIWSSKRLQMAEIAVACLTQNEFLFSTLV